MNRGALSLLVATIWGAGCRDDVASRSFARAPGEAKPAANAGRSESGDGGVGGAAGESAFGGVGGIGGAGAALGDGGASGGDAASGDGGTPGGNAEAGAPQAGAGEEPLASNPLRDIAETRLAIDLSTRRATATITLTESKSRAASFEIGDLDITSVTSEGTLLRFRAHDSTLDVETPPTTAPVQLIIEYGWRYHTDLDGIAATGYSFTWPEFCGNVFPCHSTPAEGTRFQLELSGVPSGAVAVYPREIASEAPSYMLAWTYGAYTELVLGETNAGTSVSVWFVPGGQADAVTGSAHLVGAFDWLEQSLGPYRFGSHVGTVALPWFGGGMEHHPFWHVAEDSMSDELVQVHEATHGWFGNGVRLQCWQDMVLSEGTASYLAARALEATGGTALSDPVWAQYQSELNELSVNGTSAVAWPEGCGAVDVLRSPLYSRNPYVKGAFFYRGVEQKVGRVALDGALRTFYQRFVGKAAGMQELLDVIEESTGYDADACAEAWLKVATPVPEPQPCP